MVCQYTSSGAGLADRQGRRRCRPGGRAGHGGGGSPQGQGRSRLHRGDRRGQFRVPGRGRDEPGRRLNVFLTRALISTMSPVIDGMPSDCRPAHAVGHNLLCRPHVRHKLIGASKSDGVPDSAAQGGPESPGAETTNSYKAGRPGQAHRALCALRVPPRGGYGGRCVRSPARRGPDRPDSIPCREHPAPYGLADSQVPGGRAGSGSRRADEADVDIIISTSTSTLFWGHCSRIPQRCATPRPHRGVRSTLAIVPMRIGRLGSTASHALPSDTLYLVPMRFGR